MVTKYETEVEFMAFTQNSEAVCSGISGKIILIIQKYKIVTARKSNFFFQFHTHGSLITVAINVNCGMMRHIPAFGTKLYKQKKQY
jgi:hypothetical protein